MSSGLREHFLFLQTSCEGWLQYQCFYVYWFKSNSSEHVSLKYFSDFLNNRLKTQAEAINKSTEKQSKELLVFTRESNLFSSGNAGGGYFYIEFTLYTFNLCGSAPDSLLFKKSKELAKAIEIEWKSEIEWKIYLACWFVCACFFYHQKSSRSTLSEFYALL